MITSSSLHGLLQRLSVCIEHEHGFEKKLMSGAFQEICNTWDNKMKERTAKEI